MRGYHEDEYPVLATDGRRLAPRTTAAAGLLPRQGPREEEDPPVCCWGRLTAASCERLSPAPESLFVLLAPRCPWGASSGSARGRRRVPGRTRPLGAVVRRHERAAFGSAGAPPAGGGRAG